MDQNWDGTTWINNLQQVFTYDNDHYILTRTSQHWTGTEWQNVFLRTYSYDGNHKLILQVIQNWNSGWVNNQQVISSYAINNDLEMELNQRWIVDHWEDNYRNVYTYDANHNRVLILRQNSSGGNMWVDFERFIYAYDQNNLILSQLYQEYINDEWINVYQFLLSNDSNQNRVTEVFQIWADEWINQDSFHYYYTLVSGIKDFADGASDLFIYPNPAGSTININPGNDFSGEIILEIYSCTGIKLVEKRVNPLQDKTIDVSKLLPGFYHVLIQSQRRKTVRSFVKQ